MYSNVFDLTDAKFIQNKQTILIMAVEKTLWIRIIDYRENMEKTHHDLIYKCSCRLIIFIVFVLL